MASLVADYGTDSEEESDSEDKSNRILKIPQASSVKAQNYFDEASSESSSSEEEIEENLQCKGNNSDSKLPNPLMQALPSITNCLDKTDSSGLVFTNRYDLAEKEKNAILEKHVKMTEAKILSGKAGQICFKFKKGKCRFGKSCKYSHDLESDRILGKSNPSAENVTHDSQVHNSRNFNSSKLTNFNSPNELTFPSSRSNRMYSECNSSIIPQFGMPLQPERIPQFGTPLPPDPVDEDSYLATAKRKKRSGVSDHLVPPKKAMLALEKQRQEERPWTVQK